MKWLVRIFYFVVFVIFFSFAVKNAHNVTLHFFFGSEWNIPLALLLLCFAVLGAILGAFAMLPALFRKRSELGKIKASLTQMQKEHDETVPPQVATTKNKV